MKDDISSVYLAISRYRTGLTINQCERVSLIINNRTWPVGSYGLQTHISQSLEYISV